MKKIASPNELTTELTRLLAYSQSEKPSREKLASELRGLADKLGSDVDERDAVQTAEKIMGGLHGGREEAKTYLSAIKQGDSEKILDAATELYSAAQYHASNAQTMIRWWQPKVVTLGVYLTRLRRGQ